MHQDKKDVKFVRSSSNGKVFGVHAADTDSEPNHETSNTRQNYAQESKQTN